ncbi:MAG: exodeoxyribonuclease V subunit alpha [Methylococcales bacterium]|jgi:exodeoxyribonuclease V alpha subunit|nr:exodeoxyribonuclease V subunit alpha [Methylococcales bacterium]
MQLLTILYKLANQNIIRHVDYFFAEFMAKISTHPSDDLILAACLVSHQNSQGDSCIQLKQFAETQLFFSSQLESTSLIAPPLDNWRQALLKCSVIGNSQQSTPMILDEDNHLYLAKYWHYETQISQYLISQNQHPVNINKNLLKQGLSHYFPSSSQVIDWQKIAAITAVLNRCSFISGGPGTGKTTTVTKILALLIEQNLPKQSHIALAAPTGKAAARLTESILQAKQQLSIKPSIAEQLPDQAFTLHRLLKSGHGQHAFFHHANNPLSIDILLIDEASMIDLSMMHHLLTALPSNTRVIFLGDKDQLSSVDAGSVLGDICEHGESFSEERKQLIFELTNDSIGYNENQSALQDQISFLFHSYRFDQHSGIGKLAKQINQGNFESAVEILNQAKFQDIQWSSSIDQHLLEYTQHHLIDYFKITDPIEALQYFNQFRILCATREGSQGVNNINSTIEKILRLHKLTAEHQGFYAGQPVMMNRNNYSLGLFNGDIGVILPDKSADNELRAFFLFSDGTLKSVLPQRLVDFETVYAMTIHKSQGSEFNKVMIILPDIKSTILSRELLYTGVTRAKQHCHIIAPLEILKQAVNGKIIRASGLRKRLSS